MAAHKEENLRVIFDRRSIQAGFRHMRRLLHDFRLATPPCRFAADKVHHLSKSNLRQPGARIVGNSVARPLHHCRNRRFLNGIFGRLEITKSFAPQARAPMASVLARALRSEDRMIVPNPRFASQCQNPKSLWLPSTCRTSIGIFAGFPPGPGAADARAAMLYACSGQSTSITQYPARNAFDSGNTPSVTCSPLFPARTIFASLGPSQFLRVHKNTRIVKLLVEALLKFDVALQIFFRPPGVLIPGALLAVQKPSTHCQRLVPVTTSIW